MYARSLSVCLFLIADPRLCGNQSVLSADVSLSLLDGSIRRSFLINRLLTGNMKSSRSTGCELSRDSVQAVPLLTTSLSVVNFHLLANTGGLKIFYILYALR